MERAVYAATYVGEKNRSGTKKVFKPGDPHTIEVDYHQTHSGDEVLVIRRQSHHHADKLCERTRLLERLGDQQSDSEKNSLMKERIVNAIIRMLDRAASETIARNKLELFKQRITILTGNKNPDIDRIFELLLRYAIQPDEQTRRPLAHQGFAQTTVERQK